MNPVSSIQKVQTKEKIIQIFDQQSIPKRRKGLQINIYKQQLNKLGEITWFITKYF